MLPSDSCGSPMNPVPRMAKTFDNISEASATNYLFLFAQRTLALQNEPPTPPPLNTLGLPCKTACLLWAWVQKQKQKKHLDVAKESAAPVEVEVLSASENAASAKLKDTAAKAPADKARVSTGSANSDKASQDETAPSAEKTLAIEAVALEAAAGDAAVGGGEAAAAEKEEEWATDKAHASDKEGEDKKETFALPEEIELLAEKITEYIIDHQDDAAQEDRWRTIMKRDMVKSFKKSKEAVQKVEAGVQTIEQRVETEMQRQREEMQTQREEIQGRFADVLSKLDQLAEPPMLEVECHRKESPQGAMSG